MYQHQASSVDIDNLCVVLLTMVKLCDILTLFDNDCFMMILFFIGLIDVYVITMVLLVGNYFSRQCLFMSWNIKMVLLVSGYFFNFVVS